MVDPANARITPCAQCPLRGQKALRDFTPDELAFVQTFKSDEITVTAGTSFLRQGTRNEYLFTILHGWAFR